MWSKCTAVCSCWTLTRPIPSDPVHPLVRHRRHCGCVFSTLAPPPCFIFGLEVRNVVVEMERWVLVVRIHCCLFLLNAYSAHPLRPRAPAGAASPALRVCIFDTCTPALLHFWRGGKECCCWDGRVGPCGQNALLFVLVGRLLGPSPQTPCTSWRGIAGAACEYLRLLHPRPASFLAWR